MEDQAGNSMDKYFDFQGIPDHLSPTDLQSIKDWISKEPHLPHISDRQILTILHSCYGSIELTKKTVDAYYTIRTHASELFDKRNPEEVANQLKVVHCVQLPKPGPDGSYILLLGLSDSNANKFQLVPYLRSLFSLADILYNEQPFAEGLRLCYDMVGMSVGHLAKFHPPTLKKAFLYLQEAMPVRLKGIHVINAIPLIEQLLKVIKPLMKPELYNLINIHTAAEVDRFYTFVPKNNLPENYGGREKPLNELIKISNEKMERYAGWFVEDDKFGRVNEMKRIGKAKNSSDIFGIEGSFKKLDLD